MLTRAAITEIKRQLIAARSYVQDAKAKARRGGDMDLTERLHRGPPPGAVAIGHR